MFHVCVQRFDVTKNLEKFNILGGSLGFSVLCNSAIAASYFKSCRPFFFFSCLFVHYNNESEGGQSHANRVLDICLVFSLYTNKSIYSLVMYI